MKKAGWMVVVWLVVASAVFANGSKEKYWFEVRDADNKILQKYEVQLGYRYGLIEANILLPKGCTHAVLKDGDQYLNAATRIPVAKGEQLFAALAEPATTYYLQSDAAGIGELVNAFSFAAGTVTTSLLESSMLIQNDRLTLTWVDNLEEKSHELALLNRSGRYERIRLTLVTETFPGEKALFASVGPGVDYTKKAIVFLGLLFRRPGIPPFDPQEQPDYTDFRSFAASALNLTISDTEWKLFEQSTPELENAKSAFRRSFAHYFTYGRDRVSFRGVGGDEALGVELPYADWNEDTFDALYGEQRNVYLSTYLAYCYRKGKPLLTHLFGQTLHMVGLRAQAAALPEEERQKAFAYDWRQYQPISVEESNRFADSALKYLTWGVEYTPYPAAGTVGLEEDIRAVYPARF